MNELSHVGMTACFFCGEAKEVLLDRRLKKTLPHIACYDLIPCDKCKIKLAEGITFIEATKNEGTGSIFPTGNYWVVKKEAQMIQGLDLSFLAKGMIFIEPATAHKVGFYTVKALNEITRSSHG